LKINSVIVAWRAAENESSLGAVVELDLEHCRETVLPQRP
jgi:hypothetical protein